MSELALKSPPIDRDSATPELVRAVLALLNARHFDASAEDVLDIFWMASQMPGAPLFESLSEAEKEQTSTEARRSPTKQSIGTWAATPAITPAAPDPDHELDDEDPDAEEPASHNFNGEIPVYPALPAAKHERSAEEVAADFPIPPSFADKRGFLNKWRLLMERGPSRLRKRLDIQATAMLWAREGPGDVVQTPALERQVELVVVLDHGTSMDMWRSAMRELADLFRASGGFRRITIAVLKLRQDIPVLVALEDEANENSTPIPVHTSAGTGVRLLYLIITDCVSPLWRNLAWTEEMDRWSRSATIALLQVLPERIWCRSALGVAQGYRCFSGVTLAVNRRYRPVLDGEADFDAFERTVERRSHNRQLKPLGQTLLPVFSLFEQDQSRRVIDFLRGAAAACLTCYRLQPGEVSTAIDASPLDALDAFGRSSSQLARRLARLLAAAPVISLPIARIIEKEFLGSDATRIAEAEIWTSGLLEHISEREAHADPEQALYQFREGIQQKLLDGVGPSMRQEIIRKSSSFMEEYLGRLSGFSVMLAAPERFPGALNTHAGSDPIARIAANVLRRQGPKFAALIDSIKGDAPRELANLATAFAHAGNAVCGRFAWSPDGTRLAIPLRDGSLKVIDYSQRIEQIAQIDSAGLNQAAWFPDGQHLAIACFNRMVIVLDPALKPIVHITDHKSDVMSVAVSPSMENPLLASGTAGGSVRIWDAIARKMIGAFHTSKLGLVRTVVWLNETTLVAGYYERTLIFDCSSTGIRSVKRLKTGGTAVAACVARILGSSKNNQRFLILGQSNGEVQFWNCDNWQKVSGIFPHRTLITSISASSDGQWLATKARDGSVAVIRLRSQKIIATLTTETNKSPHSSLAFHPRRRELAVSRDRDREIALYDIEKLSTRRAPLRVRVIGSLQHEKDEAAYASVCKEIGRVLAERGHTLVICSGHEGTADYGTLVGYLMAKTDRPRCVIFTNTTESNFDATRNTIEQLIATRRTAAGGLDTLLIGTLPAADSLSLLRTLFQGDQQQILTTTSVNQVIEQLNDKQLQFLSEQAARLFPDNADLLSGLSRLIKGKADVKLIVEPIRRERRDVAALTQSLSQTDGMIVIGGADLSAELIRLADSFDIPWLPVAFFGGTAGKLTPNGSKMPGADGLPTHALQKLASGPHPNRLEWAKEIALTAVDSLKPLVSHARSRTRSLPVRHLELNDGSRVISHATGVIIEQSTILTAAHCLVPYTRSMGRANFDDIFFEARVIDSPASSAASRFRRELNPSWNNDASSDFALLIDLQPAPETNAHDSKLLTTWKVTMDQPVRVISRTRSGLFREVRGTVASGEDQGLFDLVVNEQLDPDDEGAGVFAAIGGEKAMLVGIIVSSLPEQGGSFRGLAVAIDQNKLAEAYPDRLPLPNPSHPGSSPAGSPPPDQPAVVVSIKERLPHAPTTWVLVAGTGGLDLPLETVEAAQAIGRALAAAGHGLITGGWNGVDYVTTNEFTAELKSSDRQADAWVRVIMPKGRTPDFPEGLVQYADDSTWQTSQVAAADAAILIGGRGGTMTVGRMAMEQAKPVLPLAKSGADAAAFFQQRLSTWDHLMYAGVEKSEFERLNAPAPQAADLAMLLIRKLMNAQKFRGRFLSETQIRRLIERHPQGGVAHDALLFFSSSEQQSWLVTASAYAFFILDDPHTQAVDKLIQGAEPLSTLRNFRVQAVSDKPGAGMLAFGGITRWYYSLRLFPQTGALDKRLSEMLRRP